VTLASRRAWNFAAAALAATLLGAVVALYDLSLRDATFLSGWALAVGVVFLALYNARKKLPFLPLIKSAYWLQAHLYVGLVAIIVFLIHTGAVLPNGPLETALWLLFVVVALSGLAGIVLSRHLAARLRQHGERLIFERIPTFRARLAAEVEDLASRSVSETGSSTIAQYYASKLQPHFRRPRNLFAHLRESKEPLQAMCREIGSLERYLDADGRRILGEIEARVIAKDNLDYQYTLQLVLKGWLFVHIALTYAMILTALVHIALAYAFTGGTL
jgi:hypothetical protein